MKEKTMNIEQRLNQMERQIKRQRISLFVLAAALCGVVSMAATESKYGYFDEVYAKQFFVLNEKGEMAVGLTSDKNGGSIATFSPTGNMMVLLSNTVHGHGAINTYDTSGKNLLKIAATNQGEGAIITYASTGKELLSLGATEYGGSLHVHNKMGETIVTLDADKYSNGIVGAWTRMGQGRVWKSH